MHYQTTVTKKKRKRKEQTCATSSGKGPSEMLDLM